MKMLRSAIVCALLAGSVSAQNNTSAKSAGPRTADGKPDLTGVWQSSSNRRGTWEEANSGLGVGGTGTDPTAPALPSSTNRQTGEGAPYQPWAAQKVLDSYKNRAIDDPSARCLPAGVPRLYTLGLYPLKIVQTPREIVILHEYTGVFRTIPLNTKHPDDLEPSYLGDSVGHWEGDTLVVDTIGFNDKTWLVGAGTFHTEALHVTERFTRVDKDQINYEAVMEDPNVMTKPWVYRTTIMARPGTRLSEYFCAEGNQDLERYEKMIKDGIKFQR
jgi:hypothetical protein